MAEWQRRRRKKEAVLMCGCLALLCECVGREAVGTPQYPMYNININMAKG